MWGEVGEVASLNHMLTCHCHCTFLLPTSRGEEGWTITNCPSGPCLGLPGPPVGPQHPTRSHWVHKGGATRPSTPNLCRYSPSPRTRYTARGTPQCSSAVLAQYSTLSPSLYIPLQGPGPKEAACVVQDEMYGICTI